MLFSGCDDSSNAGSGESFLDSISIENYPKIDGSTSTHPLQVLIACKLLDVNYTWVDDWFDGTYRVMPNWEDTSANANFIRNEIIHNGTHGAYENLIYGNADVILVARTASSDELHAADSVGVELTTVPIALDAFVFISNINNPVNTLTVKQIQDIYTGNITNWSEVGGLDATINPYQRNDNSGSQELMLSLVMKDLEMLNFPEMILYSMMGPINMITHNKDGLGYTVYFFEQFMAPNDSLKLLGVNGVIPEYNTLKNKDYIYTTEVYAVIRSDLGRSSNAYHLFQWLQTAAGRKVIAESGYVLYD